MTAVRQHDYDYAIGRGFPIRFRELPVLSDSLRVGLEGCVATPYGIVFVFAEDDDKGGCSSFEFVWRKRYYVRLFNKRYTERGLMTKAKQFAAEIAEQLP